MKNLPAVSKYRELVAEVGRIYERARRVLAEAYWQIGRRIIEVEQDGAVRAKYGDGLLQKLSDDLSARYGAGFSVNNLERMRKFYVTYQKSPPAGKLAWSQYVELLPLRDESARGRLERRAQEEGLSRRKLRELIRKEAGEEPPPPRLPRQGGGSGKEGIVPHRFSPLRRPANLRFGTVKLADAPGVPVPDGHVLVDCGFYVYRAIPKTTAEIEITPRPTYTYPAVVERVVDGDTIWALVDLGFGTVVREKLRLHGVDTRVVSTPEGEEARDAVKRLLPPGTPMVIRSYASDAYGRFVADILCRAEPTEAPPSPALFEDIAANGVFLNQELLARGLAVRMTD